MPVSSTEITIQIDVLKKGLLSFEGDAILLPAVSDGMMVKGLANRVKKAAGADVEKEAASHAPIALVFLQCFTLALHCFSMESMENH